MHISMRSSLAVPAIAFATGLSAAATAPQTASAQEVIRVPVIAPYSGPVAFYGTNYLNGVNLAFDAVGGTVNGHKLEAYPVDDECKPETAVTQVDKLLDTAIVVIGPGCSGNMLATQSLLEQAGIPHIFTGYGAAVTDKGDKLVFRAGISDRVMAEAMASWAKDKFNIKTWGLINDTSGYGAGSGATFEKVVTAQGMKVISHVTYTPGERDFTGVILNVAKSAPDAVHVVGYEVDLGLLVKQAGQAGLKPPIIGPVAFTNQEFAEAAGSYANDHYFMTIFLADDPSPAVQELAKAWQAKYTGVPADVGTIGYEAGLILVDALKRVKGEVTKELLAEALRQTNIASSPMGPVAFDATGDRQGKGLVDIGIIKDGKPVFVSKQ